MKYKQRMIYEGTGGDASQIAMRYALVLSKVTEVCTLVSKDDDSRKEFLEDVQKLHEEYSSRRIYKTVDGERNVEECLKDPPIRVAKSVDRGQSLKRQSEKKSKRKKKSKKSNTPQSDST